MRFPARWQVSRTLVLVALVGMLGAAAALSAPLAVPAEVAEPATTLLTRQLGEVGEPPTNIGSEACLGCHTDRLAGWERSHPGLLEYAESGEFGNHACETCHGPGSVHVVGGGNAAGILHPLKLAIDDSNGLCLSCHAGSEFVTQSHWAEGPHANAQVACVTCHDPHLETPFLLRTLDRGAPLGVPGDALPVQEPLIATAPYAGEESALADAKYSDRARRFAGVERFCTSCHQTVVSDFAMRSHHPIEQAGFSCTTCHNPHQSEVKEHDLIRQTNGLCESCHVDYAGPFAFEHAPVHDVEMGEGCLTCHNPHGSTQDHLLKIDNRGLCLQCHVEQDSIGPDPHFAGTCWASGCHQQVHGSQTDVLFIDDQPGVRMAVMH